MVVGGLSTKSEADAVIVRGIPSSGAVNTTFTVTGPVIVDGTVKLPDRAGGVNTPPLYFAGVAVAFVGAATDRPNMSTRLTASVGGDPEPGPSTDSRTSRVANHQ